MRRRRLGTLSTFKKSAKKVHCKHMHVILGEDMQQHAFMHAAEVKPAYNRYCIQRFSEVRTGFSGIMDILAIPKIEISIKKV